MIKNNYDIRITQSSNYDRLKIHRELITQLIDTKIVKPKSDKCFLYLYLVILSKAYYASKSIKTSDELWHNINPGELITTIQEMIKLTSLNKKQLVTMLNTLHSNKFIHITILHDCVFKISVPNWNKYNKQNIDAFGKPSKNGFFFCNKNVLKEVMDLDVKVSELDMLIDLWCNAVYNDDVLGSHLGAIVYFGNAFDKTPLINYRDLSKRYKISKDTVARNLKKLAISGYVTVINLKSNYGSTIFVSHFVSTYFKQDDPIINDIDVYKALDVTISVEETLTLNMDHEIEVENVSENQVVFINESCDFICSKNINENHLNNLVNTLVPSIIKENGNISDNYKTDPYTPDSFFIRKIPVAYYNNHVANPESPVSFSALRNISEKVINLLESKGFYDYRTNKKALIYTFSVKQLLNNIYTLTIYDTEKNYFRKVNLKITKSMVFPSYPCTNSILLKRKILINQVPKFPNLSLESKIEYCKDGTFTFL